MVRVHYRPPLTNRRKNRRDDWSHLGGSFFPIGGLSRAERNFTSRAERNCTTERHGVSIKVPWSCYRTHLEELVNQSIHGAPYELYFTPCLNMTSASDCRLAQSTRGTSLIRLFPCYYYCEFAGSSTSGQLSEPIPAGVRRSQPNLVQRRM